MSRLVHLSGDAYLTVISKSSVGARWFSPRWYSSPENAHFTIVRVSLNPKQLIHVASRASTWMTSASDPSRTRTSAARHTNPSW
ncbi:hypothetical protein Plhal304r1_c033g0105501 [Plasmopara halstedii]